MAIPIKSPDELAHLRAAGRLAFSILQQLKPLCRPGMTTLDMAMVAESLIIKAGAAPTSKGFRSGNSPPFPSAASICLNEQTCHATPGARVIQAGDLVTIDLTLRTQAGWHADAATSFAVEEVGGGRATHLADLAARATDTIIREIRPGIRWSQALRPALDLVAAAGCHIIPGACGHGVGLALHEQPVLAVPVPRPDPRLWPGMVFTIEPIVIEAPPRLATLDDGWTVAATDGSWSAFEERMVAVTHEGVEVFTV